MSFEYSARLRKVYSHTMECPAIEFVIKYQGQILLVVRFGNKSTAQKWDDMAHACMTRERCVTIYDQGKYTYYVVVYNGRLRFETIHDNMAEYGIVNFMAPDPAYKCAGMFKQAAALIRQWHGEAIDDV